MVTLIGVTLSYLIYNHHSLVNKRNAATFYKVMGKYNNEVGTSSKIEALSASLLGADYADGRLGEGHQGKYDKDPLSRFDVFDCTTYIETIFAGALSTSESEFMRHLQALRYQDSKISFTTRNHFPSSDWLPNNQDKLMDITAQVAAHDLKIATTDIDKKSWYQSMTNSRIQSIQLNADKKEALLLQLQQEGDQFVTQTVNTPYIDLTSVFVRGAVSDDVKVERESQRNTIINNTRFNDEERETKLQALELSIQIEDSSINQSLLDRIPSGSLISMVRPDYDIKEWIGTNMNITHQSIAIRKNSILYLRHASETKETVVDEDFVRYFSQYLVSPTLKGFNVQKLKTVN